MANHRWSLRHAQGSPFELWLSVVTTVNVISFVLSPERNPLHVLVAPWDAVWAILYGLAGVGIFVGLVRERSAQFEAAGLVLLMAGIGIQVVVFATYGVSSLSGTWGTLVTLVSLAAVAFWRRRNIAKASKIIDQRQDQS